MSKVLISESSFDFKGEVIIHLKHGKRHLILIVSVSEVIANQGPSEQLNLPGIPGSTFDEIGVDNCGGEGKSSGGTNITNELKSGKFGHV